jgi:hypothetical protein
MIRRYFKVESVEFHNRPAYLEQLDKKGPVSYESID